MQCLEELSPNDLEATFNFACGCEPPCLADVKKSLGEHAIGVLRSSRAERFRLSQTERRDIIMDALDEAFHLRRLLGTHSDHHRSLNSAYAFTVADQLICKSAWERWTAVPRRTLDSYISAHGRSLAETPESYNFERMHATDRCDNLCKQEIARLYLFRFHLSTAEPSPTGDALMSQYFSISQLVYPDYAKFMIEHYTSEAERLMVDIDTFRRIDRRYFTGLASANLDKQVHVRKKPPLG